MTDENLNIDNEVLNQFNNNEKLNFQHFLDWCTSRNIKATMANLNKYIDEETENDEV